MWIRKCAVRFAHILFYFISFYLSAHNFAMKLKDANYRSHWNILEFRDQWKMMSVLNMSRGKVSGFVSFLMFRFTLFIKLRNFYFERNWNTSILLIKSMTSDLIMSHGKMSDIVSFPLFGFTLVIKQRHFDFESHWNTLIFFDQ